MSECSNLVVPCDTRQGSALSGLIFSQRRFLHISRLNILWTSREKQAKIEEIMVEYFCWLCLYIMYICLCCRKEGRGEKRQCLSRLAAGSYLMNCLSAGHLNYSRGCSRRGFMDFIFTHKYLVLILHIASQWSSAVTGSLPLMII